MAGYVSEATIAGGAFLRIDVPEVTATGPEGPFTATQYYRPDAVYAITPTTLDLAVQIAQTCRPQPVSRWDLPAIEPNERVAIDLPRDDDDEDDDSTVRNNYQTF